MSLMSGYCKKRFHGEFRVRRVHLPRSPRLSSVHLGLQGVIVRHPHTRWFYQHRSPLIIQHRASVAIQPGTSCQLPGDQYNDVSVSWPIDLFDDSYAFADIPWWDVPIADGLDSVNVDLVQYPDPSNSMSSQIDTGRYGLPVPRSIIQELEAAPFIFFSGRHIHFYHRCLELISF
jgi:hypothetical protein